MPSRVMGVIRDFSPDKDVLQEWIVQQVFNNR
jgi:hypothetical protein